MHQALCPWLLFHHLPGVGSVTQAKLLTAFGNPDLVLQEKPDNFRGLLKPVTLEALQDYQSRGRESALVQMAEHSLAVLARNQAWYLKRDDALYPKLLLEIHDAPPVLFGRGNPAVLNLPMIAMVGSRQSSRQGCELAYQFAKHLAQSGFCIGSGLAKGIDAASHSGCLVGDGTTVAVLGNGIDSIYPKQNTVLAQQIIEGGGAIISEFSPGVGPRPSHFPRRNRLISGMSVGVLVVEAALKSGSLITARCALEQNREVFSLPGSIHNPLSRGCHQLIKEGATLVENSKDIVDQVGSLLGSLPATEACKTGDEEHPLLKIMGFDVISLDSLVALTGTGVDELAAQVLDLELAGKVQQVAGGYQRCGL